MATNRETVRDKLASLLEDDLVTDLAIVEAVFNRKVDDPEGRSPIVCVLSTGSGRPASTFAGHDAGFAWRFHPP